MQFKGLKTAVGSRKEPVEAVTRVTPMKQEDILEKQVYYAKPTILMTGL
jgi:hypothetical protein